MSDAAADPFVVQIRRWVEREVLPVARELELADAYPFALVEQMQAMGLFGAIIPEAYGGAGLGFMVYAALIEEIAAGWMSLTGILNSHLIMAYNVLTHGTEQQRRRWLPKMATGERRGGIGLTEAHAGSDLQAIKTTAVRDGDDYVVNGQKSYITNGLHGNTFALLVKTDPAASPPHRGTSLFIVEKGEPGFSVGQTFAKLGYRGVDTVELLFEDFRVPAANLLGGSEGLGFRQIMSGLEVGRINVAARGLGVARAAFEAAIRYAQQRETMGKRARIDTARKRPLSDSLAVYRRARNRTEPPHAPQGTARLSHVRTPSSHLPSKSRIEASRLFSPCMARGDSRRLARRPAAPGTRRGCAVRRLGSPAGAALRSRLGSFSHARLCRVRKQAASRSV